MNPNSFEAAVTDMAISGSFQSTFLLHTNQALSPAALEDNW